MKIHVQVKAKSDLKTIWRYSFDQWGLEKANNYLFELDKAINTIAQNPEIGFSCDYIRTGYRQYNIKKHMIFYKIKTDKISILRVLHESMDYKINIQ
ncbi:MAG: toxin ParE1/3/4 [Dasania sp.]|jgi:toxin ParE1/3/4